MDEWELYTKKETQGFCVSVEGLSWSNDAFLFVQQVTDSYKVNDFPVNLQLFPQEKTTKNQNLSTFAVDKESIHL